MSPVEKNEVLARLWVKKVLLVGKLYDTKTHTLTPYIEGLWLVFEEKISHTTIGIFQQKLNFRQERL